MSDSGLFATGMPIHAPQQGPTEEDINAAIYARTSPSGKDREGYSIEEQINSCWDRCDSLGWTVTHIYRDIDQSGKDTDRPQFQKMMKDVRTLNIDVVVFWKLDRFSRSLMNAVELEAKLREHGVALHSVTEFLDTTTVAGRFNFRSIASASEFERELIRERSELWIRNAARERKWPNGSAPLGYVLDEENKLVPDVDDVKLVRKIFQRYCELKSMPKVAQELNDEGEVTEKGNDWTPRAVGEVLRNELYTGRYTIGPVDEHVEDYQIIDDALFNKAREIRYRFQSARNDGRGSMDRSRKTKHVDNIKNQYFNYLNGE